MRTLTFPRCVAGFCFAALLAGCSGATDLQAPAVTAGAQATRGVNPATLVTAPRVRPNLVHEKADAPLILSTCCAHKKMVFVTDAYGGSNFTGAVYAFDFDTAQELGQLPAPPEGWLLVQGACVDAAGNAYFANSLKSTVDEYTLGGLYIATIPDIGQNPAGCAYDRTTGVLAVSNITASSGGQGSISIFKDGVLQKTYYPPNMSKVYFLGYQDGTSILWLDGLNSSGVFQYDKFSNGTLTPVPITGGTISFPGGVQWSARTHVMNVGDQTFTSDPKIYQVSATGRILGSTTPYCDSPLACQFVQCAIKGPSIVCPDADNLNAPLYAYPDAGYPIRFYTLRYGFNLPIGIAISSNSP